jgi:hypothetical protein
MIFMASRELARALRPSAALLGGIAHPEARDVAHRLTRRQRRQTRISPTIGVVTC